MKKHNNVSRVGSEAKYGPRIVGEILHDYLENSNEPLAVAYREHTAETEEKGLKPNSEFGVTLKTLLRGDSRMKAKKQYFGLFCCDSDAVVDDYLYRDPHYTFIECASSTDVKRNPRVFDGEFITITLRSDGTYRLNFKHVVVGKDFNVDGFAIGVCNELRQALTGLVEK